MEDELRESNINLFSENEDLRFKVLDLENKLYFSNKRVEELKEEIQKIKSKKYKKNFDLFIVKEKIIKDKLKRVYIGDKEEIKNLIQIYNELITIIDLQQQILRRKK